MKFIIDGTDMKKKKVGGTKYGYLYLPKDWIGSMVSIIRHAPEGLNPSKAFPKQYKRFKLFASKKLRDKGFEISDEPINVFGKKVMPLLVGTKGNRTVICTAFYGKILKAKDIDDKLSSASNVLYIIMRDNSNISSKAKEKISSLGNVVAWRCEILPGNKRRRKCRN